MVLMLEPLHACNLTCTGCGRIREYETTIKQKLSIQECLDSVDECGAPVVSISGGEPTIYPGIGELVAKILERKKVVYLCTNGMFIRKKIAEFTPHRRFFFNVHLDGMRKSHDIAVEREGVFDAAIDGIKAAKEAGFMVCTNTTVFVETEMQELDELFAYLTTIDVDGFLISPGYSYAAVGSKEIFMTRADIRAKFRSAEAMFRKYKFYSSPLYLEFLMGKRETLVHRLGQPDPQHQGLEGPLLPDHRYPPRQLLRPLEQDALGELWSRQRPQVRELHDALGFRNNRRAGGQRPSRRHPEDGKMAVAVSRPDLDLASRPADLRGGSSSAAFANEKP